MKTIVKLIELDETEIQDLILAKARRAEEEATLAREYLEEHGRWTPRAFLAEHFDAATRFEREAAAFSRTVGIPDRERRDSAAASSGRPPA